MDSGRTGGGGALAPARGSQLIVSRTLGWEIPGKGVSAWTGGRIMPNPSIKNEKMYQDLRKEGNSKEKSARISNAAAARGKSAVGRKGGKSGSYQDWTVSELKKRAKELR